MIMGFVIWSIISAIMLGIGIWSYRSENPVGFFTGTQPPEVAVCGTVTLINYVNTLLVIPMEALFYIDCGRYTVK